MRIALLGGSFDPPHLGHLLNACFLLSTQPIDRVWLMPVFQHAFEKDLAPFEHRARMCALAAAQISPRIEVTCVEADLPPGSRTIDVLEHLVAQFPEHTFSFAIGSDILPERHKWKAFDRIEQLVHLIVVPRSGYPDALARGPALPEVSSTWVRAALARGEDVQGYVPSAVDAYVKAHHLYGAP